MIMLLIQHGVSWLFMHLPSDIKKKTNLSVITSNIIVIAILLIFVIDLVVAKRDNSYMVSERKKKQKKVLPILTKMDSEEHHTQT